MGHNELTTPWADSLANLSAGSSIMQSLLSGHSEDAPWGSHFKHDNSIRQCKFVYPYLVAYANLQCVTMHKMITTISMRPTPECEKMSLQSSTVSITVYNESWPSEIVSILYVAVVPPIAYRSKQNSD